MHGLKRAWQILSLATLLVTATGASAQENRAQDLEAAVASALEQRVERALGRHFEPRDFDVQVAVTLSTDNARRVPYLTYPVLPGAIDKLSNTRLFALIANGTVDIRIAPEFDAKTRQFAEQLVQRRLNLAKAPAVQVVTSAMEASIRTATQAATNAVNAASGGNGGNGGSGASEAAATEARELTRRAEAARRLAEEVRQEKDKILRERDDKAREAVSATDRVTRLTDELNQLRFGLSNEVWLRKNAIALAMLIAGLLVAILGVLLYARSAGRMASAVGSVAEALAEAGNRQGGGDGPGAQTAELAKANVEQAAGQGEAAAGAGYQTTATIETLWQQVELVRQELGERLKTAGDAVVLGHVAELINQKKSADAVLALEVFGEERANELFRALGRDLQDVIIKAMQSVVYERPKPLLMLEQAERLRGKLFAATLTQRRQNLRADLEKKILSLTADDLAKMAGDLEGDDLTRLFHYLDPQRIAQILGKWSASGDDTVRRKTMLLLRLPDLESDQGRDNAISAVIDRQLKVATEDKRRPYLRFYEDVVANMEEGLADLVVDTLCEDQQVSAYLRRRFMSFSQFFTLSRDVREQVLDTLTNKQLGALATGVDESLRGKIIEALSDRRRTGVEREMQTMAAERASDRDARFKEAKSRVLQGLRALAQSGMDLSAQAATNDAATMAGQAA